MWQGRQSRLLTDEVESAAALLSEPIALLGMVRECIRPAKLGVGGNTQGKPWALLPMIVCEAISGEPERVLPAAASLVLLRAAADAFDDIEDDDSAQSLAAKYGVALATNVATTLVILAERALGRLKDRGVKDGTIVRVVDAVNSYYTTACAGQHLDISHPAGQFMTEEEYLSISAMKSATSIVCACHVGALLGGADEELIDTFARFGYNLGIASQIANDIEGITKGRDIAKRKMTLPIIYAFNQADARDRRRLRRVFAERSRDVADPAEVQQTVFACGGMHYASVTMELYRQKAIDVLLELERGGTRIDRLRPFAA